MKIEMLCENTVKLYLEPDDMDRYGLTFDDIDYDQPTTQRAFRDMMNKVRRDVGFSSDGCRLLVEARPRTDGGCILMVTKQPLSRRGRDSRRELPQLSRVLEERLLFRFDQIDDLLDAEPHLRRHVGVTQSKLYRLESEYYLLVELAPDCDTGGIVNILREFGRACPFHLAAPLEERAKLLEGFMV